MWRKSYCMSVYLEETPSCSVQSFEIDFKRKVLKMYIALPSLFTKNLFFKYSMLFTISS
ncbi:hypothetical protein HanIR_Chr01g0029631 [Helianthus annuus]|nr:hypothetical protein HanIR_Chr01g0029631 [Helianthus annuus]